MKPLVGILAAAIATAAIARPLPETPRPEPAPATAERPAAEAVAPPTRPAARANRPTRPCLRYQQQVDARKMQLVDTAAAQRGVGVVWINPPTRRVCVAWA
jgi:hypothetical protein